MKNTENLNKIVLFSKPTGKTSFSSLWTIKHAFNTTKVGHTGTLDSFASGLLVVCVGSLTRLAGRITEFDKSYQAVIEFGSETDTLECTGQVVRTALLPAKDAFVKAFESFRGELDQVPPAFSAIHVDGKRASDLVRSGKEAEIPARKIKVYQSNICDLLLDDEGFVKAALVEFTVSKGTYIRSLARDIGLACNSAAHLMALRRTRVGNFELKDACGFDLLEPFTIQNAIANKKFLLENPIDQNHKETALEKDSVQEKSLQEQVRHNSIEMNKIIASNCGFGILTLKEKFKDSFHNGQKLHSNMFDSSPFEVENDFAAVFLENGFFAGLLHKDQNGYFKYAFVQH